MQQRWGACWRVCLGRRQWPVQARWRMDCMPLPTPGPTRASLTAMTTAPSAVGTKCTSRCVSWGEGEEQQAQKFGHSLHALVRTHSHHHTFLPCKPTH
eukprot:1141549-Pelagomonas_calceolata.AAC.9